LSIDGKFTPELKAQLAAADADQIIEVIVHVREQADLSSLPEETTKAEKLLYLQEFAKSHQKNLLNNLGKQSNVTILQTWWIFNGLMFMATKNIVETVAARSDVDYVIDNFNCYIDIEEKAKDVEQLRTPEWNIYKVKADSCWAAGYDGSTIVIGNIDTGVDVNHPAFGGRWVPGGWYDAINGISDPYDDHGHGTHTMGIACGGDGNGPFFNDIGVAPGANFIAAKG